MDRILSSFKHYTEESLRSEVNRLLKKFNCFKSIRSPPKSIRPMPNNSHQLSLRYRRNSREFESRRKTTPSSAKKIPNLTSQARTSCYEIEASLLIKNVFNKLFSSYQSSEWTNNELEKQCSPLIIKQFFLDCFVGEASFFKALCRPIEKKNWVSCEDFQECFDSIQLRDKRFLMQKNRVNGEKNEDSYVQKLIFFFQVSKYLNGDDLSKDGLEQVVSMAGKKSKAQVLIFVEKIMNKLSDVHKMPVVKISFYQFFKIIIKDEKI